MDSPADNCLRIVVVGHVDHGKSTLIGRLLFESGSLPEGRLEEIRALSGGAETEWAYLLDNLREEREQERTIDSAQAFFATPRRTCQIIDAPGHREFLKNMVTGAAQAEVAILVVDVEAGIEDQTRRHAALLAMLGQRQVIVVVNKMDRVGGRREPFDRVATSVADFLAQTGLTASQLIPVSAKEGWNLAGRSDSTPWYEGPTLFEALDAIELPESLSRRPFRFPVQDVYERNGRPIVVGRIESGRIESGASVVLLPSGESARIVSVEKYLETPTSAEAGESIGLVVEGVREIRRGMVLCSGRIPKTAGRFEANLFWLSPGGCAKGEPLVLRCSTQESPCRIEAVRRRINSATFEVLETDANRLGSGEIGRVEIGLEQPLVLEEFSADEPSPLGRFVLLKEGQVAGGGTVNLLLES